jgi:hypothetical protein
VRGSAADSLARAAVLPTAGLELPVKALWSVAAAGAVLVITWIVGGSIGAALNAPGLLLLAGARALGALPRLFEPSLGGWIWLGSILSALLWGLAVYVGLTIAQGGKKK